MSNSFEDDKKLWESLKRSVIPLKHKKIPSPKPPQSGKIVIKQRPVEVPSFDLYAVCENKGVGRLKRPKEFKRIDLHGMTLNQAEKNLHRFLIQCQCMNERWVLVITGKSRSRSLNEPEQLTLQQAVPRWLDQWMNLVSYYGFSKPQDGGEGALYVQVKKAQRITF